MSVKRILHPEKVWHKIGPNKLLSRGEKAYQLINTTVLEVGVFRAVGRSPIEDMDLYWYKPPNLHEQARATLLGIIL